MQTLNCTYFVVFVYLFIYYAVAVAANKDAYISYK